MARIPPVIGNRLKGSRSGFIIQPMRFLLMLLLAGCAAAQNSDLALLVGISGPRGQTTTNGSTTTTTGSVTPSFQVNYAWQVLQRAVDLYVELPLVVPVRVSGAVVVSGRQASVTGNDGSDIIFTPGMRVKFSPESHVSFYAAAGAGIASFAPTPSVVVDSAGVSVSPGNRQNSFAGGFGGGVDFRLTRLLSLRVDARDFVTGAGLAGVSGRNHGILQFGIAFHF